MLTQTGETVSKHTLIQLRKQLGYSSFVWEKAKITDFQFRKQKTESQILNLTNSLASGRKMRRQEN